MGYVIAGVIWIAALILFACAWYSGGGDRWD